MSLSYIEVSDHMTENETLSQSSGFLHKVFNRQLLPSMLVSLGYTLNVLFDGIIVGRKLGVESFAAINVCMPVYLFLCAAGSLIGIGCYLLSSRAIGAGDTKKSNRIFNSALLLMAIVSMLTTLAGVFLTEPITRLLCGGTFSRDVYDYAWVTLIGSSVKLFLYIPMYYLILDGKGRWASVCTVVMTAVNILLDVVMVCLWNMGTAGAAWASVIATAISTVMGMTVLLHRGTFSINFKFERGRMLIDMAFYGLPNAMNNLAAALRVLFLNRLLIGVGTEALCLFSVLNNLSELSLVIVDGVPKTATPLLAIYSAEHSNSGIRILMKHQAKITLVLSAVFAVAVTVLSGFIAPLYGMELAAYTQVLLPFACFGIATVFAAILRMLILYYNADGKNLLSTLLTVARIALMPVLCLWLAIRFNLYLWAFWPVAEAVTLLLLVTLLFLLRGRNGSFLLLLKDNEAEKSLEFSVPAEDTEICGASEKIASYCAEFGMNPKQTMRISLALEEVLTLMRTKCIGDSNETFDLRVFTGDGRTGIRIRCTGQRYNPFEQPDDADECMGVRMINSLSTDVIYNFVYGMNNLLILI